MADIWREVHYPMLTLWEIMTERHNMRQRSSPVTVLTSLLWFHCETYSPYSITVLQPSPCLPWSTTTSGQHLWSIASISTAGNYNHIQNMLEKMRGCTANGTHTVCCSQIILQSASGDSHYKLCGGLYTRTKRTSSQRSGHGSSWHGPSWYSRI